MKTGTDIYQVSFLFLWMMNLHASSSFKLATVMVMSKFGKNASASFCLMSTLPVQLQTPRLIPATPFRRNSSDKILGKVVKYVIVKLISQESIPCYPDLNYQKLQKRNNDNKITRNC